MSFNQFRSDKVSDSQYRKFGNRSGNTASSYQRTKSGKSSGGGGPTPPGSLQSSRSFKKPNNVQGGPSREGAPSVNPELNPAPTRNSQNGVHQQAPSREMADGPARTAAARITESPSTPSTNPADPKILPLQSDSGSSNPKLMQTPLKTEGGPPRGFSLQFGSIGPGFVNGMEIPPRTTSAPPNLDEQKRDQSRVEFSRPGPAVPIPSVPKQQLAVKESSVAKQKHPLVAVSNPLPDMKKETHAPSQAPLSLPQKPSAVHVSGLPMPVPFHQPHGPIQFGVTPQLQPQVVSSTSLQMPPILSAGSSPLLQQPMFIPAIQPLPMHHHGIMHQGQVMNFTNQLRPRLSHQIGSRGINIGPQFTPPQAGKFNSPRRAVKITHPDTREELSLDRREDGIAGGPPKSGIHTGVLPQPQPVPSLRPAHPNNYYSSSFSSPYYSPASVVPSIQITPNPQTAKANHSNNQSHRNPILGNATAKGKRPKSATAKGKRQKNELLQKADTARSTSDAYKGPDSGPGRGSDRSAGGARSDRRETLSVGDDKWNKEPGPFPSRVQRADVGYGNTMGGFRPGSGGNSGVLRYPRGQVPGHHPGGILSGPLQPLNTSQRDNADADRWQRGTNFQKGLIPSPQTPAEMMHKAEKKYERGKVADEEQAKQRQLKGILNKLTPQNFERLFEQVKAVNIDNAMTLTGVISQIFDKALMEPTLYADFCFHLAGELPDFSEGDEKITFRREFLNKCQEKFERGEREQKEADRVEVEGEGTQSNEEREEKRVQARRRRLGNIRLIGELYKKKMLTERIMHECINKLMGQHQNPDEEDIEALCKLMSTIGEMIDHPKAKEHMDAYFDRMGALSNNMRYSSRVRFMLKDSIDLRNKWQQRRKVEGPKNIEEVHRDAAHERQAQSNRLTRGSSMNASSRRGTPSDFGPRGSSVLASPSSQTGGLRNFPSQGQRFGGTQDVRMEDRQPLYESRNMSVSLPQRAAGNDTLTLGPQGGHHPGGILSGPLQPLNTSQRESKERVEYLQSKVSKQTSIDMKEETKDCIMGTNNSSITIEVEQLERESKKSLTPSVGIEFSKTVEVDLIPSAVFSGNHDTTSDESDLSNTVLELNDTASLSVAGSNDRAPLEMSRPKSATAKGKWQKKGLLLKADAASSTSDLYTAYKGPENKELTLSTESSEGGSGCIDLKKLPADTKEGIKAGKSEAQVKSEPENGEDAEDIRGEGSEMSMAKASASASLFTHLFARGGEVAMGVLSNKVERDLIKPGDHIYSWRSAYIYAHHGIYAGDGKVIHFTRGAGQEIGTGTALDKFIFSSSPSHNPINPCPNCGDQSRLDGVICSCLDCFLAGGDLYLFEYDVKVAFFLAKARGGTCTLAESDPPGAALHRASFLLENGFGVYHISKNNCEDFAIYCKTGLVSENIFSVPRSGQATSFMAFATTVMSSPLRFLITNLGGLAVVANFGGLAVGAGMYCVSRLASDMGVRRDVVRVPVETLVEYLGTRRR